MEILTVHEIYQRVIIYDDGSIKVESSIAKDITSEYLEQNTQLIDKVSEVVNVNQTMMKYGCIGYKKDGNLDAVLVHGEEITVFYENRLQVVAKIHMKHRRIDRVYSIISSDPDLNYDSHLKITYYPLKKHMEISKIQN